MKRLMVGAWQLMALVAALGGCAVVSVADSAASVAANAVGTAANVAVDAAGVAAHVTASGVRAVTP